MESSENFQVNLSGVIDILARHLYSAPDVYLRELLQNCVDAITARRLLEPSFKGEIRLELQVNDGGENGSPTHTLMIEDNGVGLTPEEAHRFLSTIGHHRPVRHRHAVLPDGRRPHRGGQPVGA